MSYRRHALLFDRGLLLSLVGDPLVIVDAGARGGAMEPWRSLMQVAPPGALHVVGFEPGQDDPGQDDSDAAIPGYEGLPVALWNTETNVQLHVGIDPATSSVPAPAPAVLARFQRKHEAPRATRATIDVSTRTLDAIASEQNLDVDVVKLDTQGSEYEILEGARATLNRQVTAVLAETWMIEAHCGQRLAHDVIHLVLDAGFDLADVNVGARWLRRVADRTPIFGKGQIVQLDLLFLKCPEAVVDRAHGVTKLLKAAAIADVYGFSDHAIEVLERGRDQFAEDHELLRTVEGLIMKHRGRPRRLPMAVREMALHVGTRLTGRDLRDFAPLR